MPKATSPASRALTLACLVVLFALAFYGELRTGATTSDDLYYEQHVITGRLGALATELATGAGRFHHYLHVSLTSLPYFLDAEPVRKVLALALFAVALGSFAYVAGRIAGLASLGFLAALAAIAFYQDNWHHNILTSYPLVFDSGLLCITWAAFCLLRHGQSGRGRFLVLANLLAFAAFCHFEAFLCYVPLFGAVIWLAGEKNATPPRERLRTLALANIATVLYVIIYLAYRALHPSHYEGNALDLTHPLRILKTVLAYSDSGLPLGAFHLNIDYIDRFPVITTKLVLDFGGYLSGLVHNWWRMRPAWIAETLLTGALAYHLLTRSSDRPRWRLLPALAVLYAAYCPNFLIALSPKYQEPTTHGITWYVTSTFSAYAWAVLLALAGLWLCGRLSGRPRARKTLAAGLAGLAGALALINASVNASVLESKIAAASRWRLAMVAAQSPVFDALPEGTVLIAPDLFTAVNVELTHPGYWDDWFAHRTGKHLHVVAGVDPAHPPALPVYALRRLSAPTDPQTAVALARVARLGPPAPDPYAPRPDQPSLLADRVDIACDVTNRFYDILFEDGGAWRRLPAHAVGRRGLAETEITGRAIPVASLALLPAGSLAVAPASPLRLRFGPGFSAPERAITGPVVWAGNDAEMTLTNSGDAPATARLGFTLIALAPVRLVATGPGISREIDSTGLSTPVSFACLLPPGVSRLTVRALPPLAAPGKRFGVLGATLVPSDAAR